MRFNSSSQITHICLTLSSGTPERELQMFLARCLHGREHSKPVQAVTERPFVILFFWPDLGAGLLCKVLIFILHHCKADLKPALTSYNTLCRWGRYLQTRWERKIMQTASWGLVELFAKQEKQLLTLSLFRAHWYFRLLWDRQDTWLGYIHFPYTQKMAWSTFDRLSIHRQTLSPVWQEASRSHMRSVNTNLCAPNTDRFKRRGSRHPSNQ